MSLCKCVYWININFDHFPHIASLGLILRANNQLSPPTIQTKFLQHWFFRLPDLSQCVFPSSAAKTYSSKVSCEQDKTSNIYITSLVWILRTFFITGETNFLISGVLWSLVQSTADFDKIKHIKIILHHLFEFWNP